MASIQRNGSGYRVHYEKNGKRLRSHTFRTVAEAELWQRNNLAWVTVETVSRLVAEWEADEPSDHRRHAGVYLRKEIERMGWGAISRLSLADLMHWGKTCSPRYAQYLMTVLHWGRDRWNLPVRDDALSWKPPKYQRKPAAPLLTDAQVAAIRSEAIDLGDRAFAVVDYLLTYGARPITASRLRLGNLDAEHCCLVIDNAKHSGGWRHQITQRHLDQWQGLHGPNSSAESPLFLHYKEDRAWRVVNGSARELADWYKATIGKRCKLGHLRGIYHLKRHAITSMLRRGLDPGTVAAFTGHLDTQQVLTYAKTNVDLQNAALTTMFPDDVPKDVPKFLDAAS